MPDLLIELLSEEIPARFQARAAADLQRLVTGALVEAGLAYEGAKAFATPRRLALTVAGVPARSPDRREERRGPRVGAPDKAVEGFLRGSGLSSIDQAEVRSDPKKGDFYVAVIEEPGRTAEDVVAGFMPDLIRTFPWQKSMRWGAASATPGSLSWVRPLQSIVCLFGPETSDTEVVPFEVDGIASGRTTRGHRFMAPEPFEVRRFDDYAPTLERAKVVLDAERRRDTILHDARDQALALSLELVEDDALAAEIAGLVEWPVVMVGAFDEAFLEMPFEVIRTTIRTHQKCFVLQKPNGAGPANRFVLVSNLEASDGGAAIVAGNERVIRARLADARYFWDTDLAVPLADRVPALDAITFHEKLGTQGDRVRRIIALARDLAPAVGADPDLAARAAELAKADLVSEMVGEFPELQGFMGGTYARVQGEKPEVVSAIADHYRPQGPSDSVPSDPVTVAVALAEKLDMLVGFWTIDEKPTGSKDPFALRRAALGVIRLVLDNGVRLDLGDAITSHRARFAVGEPIAADLLAFFADRLKVQMRESGARHDLVDAVLAVADPGDLVGIVRRVEALGAFLATDAGESLLAGYRRGINILTDEEKKAGEPYDDAVDPALLRDPAERTLYEAASAAAGEVKAAVAIEDFADAMAALSRLREPVDTFFETVMVNADDPSVRANRLRLLNAIRVATLSVADFSRIGG